MRVSSKYETGSKKILGGGGRNTSVWDGEEHTYMYIYVYLVATCRLSLFSVFAIIKNFSHLLFTATNQRNILVDCPLFDQIGQYYEPNLWIRAAICTGWETIIQQYMVVVKYTFSSEATQSDGGGGQGITFILYIGQLFLCCRTTGWGWLQRYHRMRWEWLSHCHRTGWGWLPAHCHRMGWGWL